MSSKGPKEYGISVHKVHIFTYGGKGNYAAISRGEEGIGFWIIT
jgi:hypothetical protein